jgi:Tfp pilus assembly protein PilW
VRPGTTLVIALLLGALLVAATLQFFFLSR